MGAQRAAEAGPETLTINSTAGSTGRWRWWTRLGEAEFRAGDEFTAADIMNVFSLTTMRHFMPVDLSPYPNIGVYLRRIGARDGYRRAMLKGDPGMALI